MYSDSRIFKPMRSKPEARLQAANSGPPGFENFALGSACGFYPAQSPGAFLAVVAGEQEIPQTKKDSSTQRVDKDQAPHDSL